MTEKNTVQQNVSLLGLVALTVTTVIGAGVFNLPRDLAKSVAPGPALIALVFASIAFAVFVYCLKYLQDHYPDLDAGIFSFPEQGFGKFIGFLSCVGYWLSIVVGNISLGVLSVSSLGYFIPMFRGGNNIPSLILLSVILWVFYYICASGARNASLVNTVIWFAKMIPIVVFIIALLMAFKVDVFNSGLWENAFASNDLPSSINGQIGTAMSSTIWVYVGIEGALIYSARAKSKSDASKAIVISYIVIAVTYLLLTFLTFGVLSQVQVSKMEVPALGGILEAVVGKWGAILMNLGIALSAMGCWFGCCLFAGEILDVAAKHEIVPKFFGVENTVGQPTNSLLVSTIIQQAFFITIIINESIYNVMALFASSTMLVPYFTVSLTMIKKSIRFDNGFKLNALLGCISTIAMGYLMYSTGWKYIIITALLFAPCMIVYYLARKENNKKFLTNIEKIIALVIVALAIVSLVLIFNGTIDLSTM
ncbi:MULTISPECIES: amino acid permease [unclassified Streptococcus]|jgi:amino acid permease|uniref:amino acid permease n=1 Tax=Streptococcus TaxID=1301 RepID=UPI0012492A53|nr:amino acid permease [Streptococcus sp. LPB0220]QEW08833.1 amino acid permease [Streptococcus sp. LPB0220]